MPGLSSLPCISRRGWRAGWLLAAVVSWPAVGRAAPDTPIEGRVEAADGRVVPGIWVLALPAEGGAVSAAGQTDGQGRFRLVVPGRRHHLGVASPGWQVARIDRTPAGLTRLQLRPVFASREELRAALARSAGRAHWQAVGLPPTGEFALVRGQVLDPVGAPLPGVRVIVVDGRGRATAATFTNQAGEYTVLAPAGAIRVHLVAGGFKVRQATGTDQGLDFVLEIDAAMETISVSTGHVLRFRTSDSSWPEYVPPPAVAAWLRFAHGINLDGGCSTPPSSANQPRGAAVSPTAVGGTGRPPSCPVSVAVRGKQKWWWLKLLESPPPNPASIASWEE